jgi:hypothetical protein
MKLTVTALAALALASIAFQPAMARKHEQGIPHFVPGHYVAGHTTSSHYVETYTRKNGTVVQGHFVQGRYIPGHFTKDRWRK